jgi:hypothetical protein
MSSASDETQAFVERWSFTAECALCGAKVDIPVHRVSADTARGTMENGGKEIGTANFRGVQVMAPDVCPKCRSLRRV